MKLFKFTALWCRWCRAYSPAIEKFARENNLQITEYDIDEVPLAQRYWDIETIPTVILVDCDDIEIARLDDIIDETTLNEKFSPYL